MIGSKRRSQPELLIKLASSSSSSSSTTAPQPLIVNANRIRCCSRIAAALEPDTDEWDLTNLKIDGQPVQRETVVTWLNIIYTTISGATYEAQADVCRTVKGLYELLAFSDAVDTEPGIVMASLAHLDQLVIRVSVGNQQVQLSICDHCYYFDRMQLICATATKRWQVGIPLESQQEQQQLSTEVAQQLEALLYQAYTMKLYSLTQRIHSFIASSAGNSTGSSILYGVLGLIFTDCVLQAAVGPAASEATQKSFISSVITQPCGFVPGTCWSSQLLKPLRLPEELQEPLCFQAELLQDWLGSSAGEKVLVTLDLFDTSTITVGHTSWPAQLLVGPAVTGDAAFRKLMGSRVVGPSD